MADDYKIAKRAAMDGIREWLNALRNQYPSEHFYAFAIYTDGDFTAPEPAANSVERLNDKLQRNADTNGKERCMFKWYPGEWAHSGDGRHVVHRAWDAFDEIEEPDGPEPWDDEELEGINSQFAKRLAATVDALRQLSDEGVFGEGETRMTVFCAIMDHPESGWVECESAKRINPPDVFERFVQEQRMAAELCYGEDANKPGRLAKVLRRLYG